MKEKGRKKSKKKHLAQRRRNRYNKGMFRPEHMKLTKILLGGLFLIAFLSVVAWQKIYAQEELSNGIKRSELEEQIKKFEEEAAGLDMILQGIQQEGRTLANETKEIDTEVKRRELEIKRLTLTIRRANLEIRQKEESIADLSGRIDRARESLAASLFIFYSYGQENILSILVKNQTLSGFFGSLSNLEKLQSTIYNVLSGFKEDRTVLGREKEVLKSFEQEQRELVALQEVERRLLAQKKREKEELLRLNKGKEAVFQQLLKSKKKALAPLRTQLFYLEKTGITAEEAVKFAELAANRVGIRPAFLLALLEVETGKQFEEGIISVGSNVGTGNWRDDMYLCYQRLGRYYGGANIAKYNTRAEREKAVFFKITGALGLDPDKMPVSKEPPYAGCGGAMGPAQFIPTTWLLYADRVAELTGHNPPNPWNIEDAFTASALFLADAGAASKTTAGEIRAAKTYLSGSPSCTRYVCNSYANRIISLARDIERIL